MKEDIEDNNLKINAKLLRMLAHLRDRDAASFFNLVFKALKNNPTYAIDDPTPSDKKIEALERVLEYFTSTEEYENCIVVKDIITKIQELD